MRKGASAHELSAPFVDGQQAKRAHKDRYQKHNPIKKGSVDQRFQQDGLDRHRVQKDRNKATDRVEKKKALPRCLPTYLIGITNKFVIECL